MNVLFLDIDGVLNSYAEHAYPIKNKVDDANARYAAGIDPRRVAILNTIISRSKASVVISSTWRTQFSTGTLKLLLEAQGLKASILGKTPIMGLTPIDERSAKVWPRVFFARDYGWRTPRFSEYDYPRRAYEVHAWLIDFASNLGVKGIAILDDINGWAHMEPFLVQTKPMEGLKERHVEEAIEAMSLPIEALLEKF